MLRIRKKQMDALGAHVRAAFLAEATSHIEALDAPRFEGWSRSQLARWIDGRIDRAVTVGLDDGPRLLAWLEIAADHGDAFADDPYVVHLLAADEALDDWPLTRSLIEAAASDVVGGEVS
jgi:hypothetical protein